MPSATIIPIEDEMRRSYLDYAMSTIIGRALPDARDGLKPVHRRILYAMYELNNMHDKPYKKSARVVGDVMGKFHPHGDQAIYDAVTRMVQDFSLRYPLIDGQGNFGSIDGDSPAAMRYTEIRLSRIAEEILEDIEKDTVAFKLNYDESAKEPVVLPTRIPNLLINGSSGIAVGMATNIPPHNITEVIDGTIAFIDNPSITVSELMRYVPGPDFPTQAIIYGRNGIKDAYETGKGHILLRAAANIEKSKKDGREAIIITELPYQVNKARLIESIVELVNEKRVEGISNIRDESNREGIRVVIELKRNEFALPILNKLYKQTQLQTTFGINFLTIVNNEPKLLNLREMIGQFVDFRKEVVTRRSIFELNKAKERLHILEGLKIALDNIDQVVSIIRKAKNTEEARTNLINAFQLSEKQAQSILDMRLARLTNLERAKILDELKAVQEEIKRLTEILENEQLLMELIKKELLEVKEKYGDQRLTEIVDELPEITIEDMIKEEEVVVTITHGGFIKRTPLDQYKQQMRGGKGKIGIAVREDDFVNQLYIASTHSYIILFTTAGKAHIRKVHTIPEAQLSSRGKPVINLIKAEKDEKITAVTHVKDFPEDGYLLLATRKGQVKKMSLSLLKNLRNPGIKVIDLPEDDSLMDVLPLNAGDEVVIATKRGMAIRFKEEDIRSMGRTAYGVRGIRLRREDEVVSIDVLTSDCSLFTVTEKGFGKRVDCTQYKVQARGGTGVINVTCEKKNGDVVGVKRVSQNDEIILVTNTGRTIRFNTSTIPVHKRGGLGVKLMGLKDEEEKISGVGAISEE
ncbi:MAG: DNA gyrase subunit A [Syntrophorhabdaceae bacterium PtaU1.Bin034]|nr:MAG: DNA gyrase subunit A [Syntrophorhabdaceae bacterium PtaU1.Bin034]